MNRKQFSIDRVLFVIILSYISKQKYKTELRGDGERVKKMLKYICTLCTLCVFYIIFEQQIQIRKNFHEFKIEQVYIVQILNCTL